MKEPTASLFHSQSKLKHLVSMHKENNLCLSRDNKIKEPFSNYIPCSFLQKVKRLTPKA